jgi:hypothetical protein
MLKEENPNIKKIRRLQHITHTEKVKLIYSKVRNNINPRRNESIQKVQVMDSKGNISEYSKPNEIATKVASYNTKHFNQAENTPMAQYGTSDITMQEYNKYSKNDQELIERFTRSMEQESDKVISPLLEEKDWMLKTWGKFKVYCETELNQFSRPAHWSRLSFKLKDKKTGT